MEMRNSRPSSSASAQEGSLGVVALICMNVIASVSIVSVNKILVENYGFKHVLLLTSAHFFTGYAFLHIASHEKIGLFKRASAPFDAVMRIAVAGMVSIVLMNYSLRYNSMGTYQILKVAVLPVTIALTHFQKIASPTRHEVLAATLVMVGTLICTVSDVSIRIFGVLIGAAAVATTAQYQIYQGSIQKQCGISSTQALYLMSLPQGVLALIASVLLETSWTERWGSSAGKSVTNDIWGHPYTVGEFFVILGTCFFAVLLNYSTIGVIGKTSAVAMQFVNQLKTVLVVSLAFVLFPQPGGVTFGRIATLVAGLSCVFAGVGWYTKLKQSGSR